MYQKPRLIVILAQSIGGSKIHLKTASSSRKSLCGKNVSIGVNLSYDSIATFRSGHEYGKFLIKKATCDACKQKYRKKLKEFRYWTKAERKAMYDATFEPVPTPRPLPKKASIGGVNKVMSNIRERLRRKSARWADEGKLFTANKSAYYGGMKGPRLVSWGEREHAAFLIGVNFTIQEIFNDFKLEKYDRYLDEVYRELHELVTGEELPTVKDERNVTQE